MTKDNIVTFGCRLNSFESEIIRDNIKKSGLEDVVVFNTCSVTSEAERQAKQAIRKYNRENPETSIIVTGCAAQINPQKFAELSGVTKVLGNEEKLDIKSYLSKDNDTQVLAGDIMSVSDIPTHFVGGIENRTRAFLQVQNGCDHRCTFCVIPFGRGNSRSVPIDEIIKQAKILSDSGYNEIVITGVDITDYGKNLSGKPSLGKMLESLLKRVPDIKRIRLSSVDIAEIDCNLIDLISSENRIMPHLHLSLQSGDNMILKRMKRRHNSDDVMEFCDKIKTSRPDIVFGADIITGFPTETDKMFENTLNMVNEVNIPYLHVFPYSERKGTPAAEIPRDKQVPVKIRKKRASVLRKASSYILKEFLNSRIGKRESVIIEKQGIGRTEQFVSIILKEEKNRKDGEIIHISSTSTDGKTLFE